MIMISKRSIDDLCFREMKKKNYLFAGREKSSRVIEVFAYGHSDAVAIAM